MVWAAVDQRDKWRQEEEEVSLHLSFFLLLLLLPLFKKISLDWWAATSSSISLRVLVDSMWRHRGILYTITSVCLITVGMAPLSPTLFVNKRAKKLLLLFLSFPNYDGVCWDDDGSRSRLLSFNNNNNKPRKEKKNGQTEELWWVTG